MAPSRRSAEGSPSGSPVRSRQSLPGAADYCRRITEAHRLDRQAAKSLRIITGALVTIIIGGLFFVLANASWPRNGFDLVVLVQVSEAGLNVFLLLSAAILFLVTAETRIKRRRALKAIHELRALAHVIDMHQLTKDPERLLARMAETPSSPKHNLSPAELGRYLDYCSEMFSLIGKLPHCTCRSSTTQWRLPQSMRWKI